jgi:3-phenylpropionate/cinnamic acid dioxygenase small subunit
VTLTRAEAEALLYREARLIDEGRLDEWLAMFTPDSRYWVPILDDDLGGEPSIIDDDRQRLEERIYRLTSTPAYAQRPPSRTQHNISNVEVLEPASDGSVEVRCNLLLVELRTGDATQAGLGKQRLLAARCLYVFAGGPDWRIRLRKLTLIDRDLPHYNLSFIL